MPSKEQVARVSLKCDGVAVSLKRMTVVGRRSTRGAPTSHHTYIYLKASNSWKKPAEVVGRQRVKPGSGGRI